MESQPRLRPKLEPPAPVNGGIRWRSRYHDLLDLQQRERDLQKTDDPAGEDASARPEAPEDGAPHIGSTPAPEARVGEEYIYQARAFDCDTNGFTWYFEKGAPGMAVDRHTGKVTWTPTEGGMVEVVLCARSLYGKTARQSWTICVRKAAAVREPVPNKRFCEALRRQAARRTQPIRAVWREGRRRDDANRQAAPPGAPRRVAMPLRV